MAQMTETVVSHDSAASFSSLFLLCNPVLEHFAAKEMSVQLLCYIHVVSEMCQEL